MNKQNFNPEKEFQKELQKEFEAVIFPADLIQPLFLGNYLKVVEYRTPLDLNCDINTFKSIYEGKNWNLNNIPVVLNGLLSCSAKELDLTPAQYIELLDQMGDMREEWKKLALPIEKKVFGKIQTQISLRTPNNGRMANPNLRK